MCAYTTLSALLVACLRVDGRASALALLRLARPADVLAWVGATGTLVFGLWLVSDAAIYDLWDGWIIGALVLWLIAEEAIRREDLLFRKGRQVVRSATRPISATSFAHVTRSRCTSSEAHRCSACSS